MFTYDWCISIHFVCFSVSISLLVIVLFRIVSGNDRLVFFEAFYGLYYPCLLQAG